MAPIDPSFPHCPAGSGAIRNQIESGPGPNRTRSRPARGGVRLATGQPARLPWIENLFVQDIGRDAVRDSRRGLVDRIPRQMGVSRRRFQPAVAQQLAE